MKKIINILFSMPTMGFLILAFATSLAVATFIENDFGTTASKAVVYNATWFNVLLGLLCLNLISNIFRVKMWNKKKFTIFLFHISFIIILLGSAITRFISYEGIMHIREGATSSIMMSDQTYVDVKIVDNNQTIKKEGTILISHLNPKAYGQTVKVNDKKFRFKSVKFVPNARESITETKDAGDPYIVLTTSYGGGSRETYYFKYNESYRVGPYHINFGDLEIPGAINIKLINGLLSVNPPDTITTTSMAGTAGTKLASNEWNSFSNGFLYKMQGLNLVLSNFYSNAKLDYVSNNGGETKLMDAVIVEASSGDETRTIAMRGGKGYLGLKNTFNLNGAEVSLTFGSKNIQLPFAVKLIDFQLDRYPGSMSPSSYASDVILIDSEAGIEEPFRIFMNNVLNHKGFRLFQSSYDSDEQGTILSVNHDYWGTMFTYIGYLLMTIGMMLSLVNKSSRFSKLTKSINNSSKKAKTVGAVVIAMMFVGPQAFAQHNHDNTFNEKSIPIVDKDHAEQFGKLMVQSVDGRLKPINTLSSEVVRKITGGKSSFFGLNVDQMFLGILSNPLIWQKAPMIKVKHDKIKGIIGIEGKYASYLDFIDMTRGSYKLSEAVNKAYAKKPATRNTFDKDLIAVDERLNVAYMIFIGDFLKILPDPNDPMKSWYSPEAPILGHSSEDSAFLNTVIPTYLTSLSTGNMLLADELLVGLDDYQKKFGADIMPPQAKINLEIRYNKMNLFNRLGSLYGLLGFIMIVFSFIAVFKNTKIIRAILKVMLGLVIVGFLLQTFGLAARWYISGHAPWSDGYESMIYIAWVSMLAGLIFARKSNMTLAATTILASIILMVAHLSWMNPEITNLVPVLKSYWLTIHVSIITGSYGFLALSMLLGFLNLLLMIFRNRKNHINMNNNIAELTSISERSMTVGLYMLTVGTFLGGVWANESWGRYWGWDPKETWALISVLVYSFILHMRWIPGLRGKFSFNFISVIGFFSIIMTYFGVNFYLSGLHSYATGDPMPIPDFVYYMVATIAIAGILAYMKETKFSEKKKK